MDVVKKALVDTNGGVPGAPSISCALIATWQTTTAWNTSLIASHPKMGKSNENILY